VSASVGWMCGKFDGGGEERRLRGSPTTRPSEMLLDAVMLLDGVRVYLARAQMDGLRFVRSVSGFQHCHRMHALGGGGGCTRLTNHRRLAGGCGGEE